MDNYQTFTITPEFSISIKSPPRKIELSDHAHAAVESIWQREFERTKGRLFNDKILSMISWDKDRLVGEFVDYRYYIAQLNDPKLEPFLKIRPISISGIIYAEDKILIGLRAETLSQNPLFYELAPSGGIDPSVVEGDKINIKKLVEKELVEETGIMLEDTLSINFFALVYDPLQQSFEICVKIITDPKKINSVVFPIDEYIRFFWISAQDMAHFVTVHRERFIPMSLHILRILKLKGIHEVY